MKRPLRKHPGLLVPRALLLLSTPLAAGSPAVLAGARAPVIPRPAQLAAAPSSVSGRSPWRRIGGPSPAPSIVDRAARQAPPLARRSYEPLPAWQLGGFELAAYGGAATTWNSEAHTATPGLSQVALTGVSWTDEALQNPPYYGGRFAYWVPDSPRLGASLEFAHVKSFAAAGDTLLPEHGNNVVTLNAHYRWLPDRGQRGGFTRELTPYVGLGAGVAAPRSDGGSFTAAGYRVTGPAARATTGLAWRVSDRVALYSEYQLGWTEFDASVPGGETYSAEPWSQHLVLGVSWTP